MTIDYITEIIVWILTPASEQSAQSYYETNYIFAHQKK